MTDPTDKSIPQELLDKVKHSDMNATFELGETLLRKGDYPLARLCFAMAYEQGHKEAGRKVDKLVDQKK